MAIVYRHIRLDKNEPFYIGIGKEEGRAYAVRDRNKHWKSIAKKGYKVEVVLEDLTWDQACKKEREFIALYGRRDLGLGTLANMTDGGDGTIHHSPEVIKSIKKKLTGRKKSIESAKKSAVSRTGLKRTKITGLRISARLKNKLKSESHKFNMAIAKQGCNNNHLKKPIVQLDKDKNIINIFNSQIEAASLTGISKSSINNNLKNLAKSAGGFIFKYKN